MKTAMLTSFITTIVLSLSLSMFTYAGPNLLAKIYAQNENETSVQGMKNMSNATAAIGKIPSMSTPGQKTFYVFTSEVENVDENKLKVAGDSFSVHTLVVNKGDKVTQIL
jgi:hypothetical protein